MNESNGQFENDFEMDDEIPLPGPFPNYERNVLEDSEDVRGLEGLDIAKMVGTKSSNTSDSSNSSKTLTSPLRHSTKAQEFLAMLMERVAQCDVPPCARHLLHPDVRTLVKICSVLQENAGDEPFYLSSYVAAGLLKVDQRKAHRWLQLLCRHKILTLTKPGKQKVANRYRFTGKQAGGSSQKQDL
jgi:hypothetical protein